MKDLNLNDSIKVHDPINEIYAIVAKMKVAGIDVTTDKPSEEK